MKTQALQSLWIPAKRPSGHIIMVLHGRGDSYHGFTWLPAAMGLNNVNYLMINAPDASFTGFSWYGMPPDQLPGVLRSRVLLDRVLDEIVACGYKTRDVMVIGFSQGCLMTLEWGARTSHRLAGCVGISGYCYDPELLMKELSSHARQMPWWVTHGEADEVLPFTRTREQIQFLQEQGLPIQFHSFKKGHTIDEKMELPLLKTWINQALALP